MNTSPPFSPLIYLVVPDVLLIGTISFNASRRWRFLTFCIFVVLSSYPFDIGSTTGNAVEDYSAANMLSCQTLIALTLLVLVEPGPMEKFRHESDVMPPTSLPWYKRLYWALSVVHGPRGVGWNYQVPYLPPRPVCTRRAFVITRLLRIFGLYLLLDSLQTYQRIYPGDVGSLMLLPFGWYIHRRLTLILFASATYTMLSINYYLLAILGVSLRLTAPSDWPDLFGEFRHAYSLDRFWGRTWHQLLRRLLVAPNAAMSRLLGYKRGTVLYSLLQLYSAFFVSGLVHIAFIGPTGAKARADTIRMSMICFTLQPIAMTVEQLVIWFGKQKLGLNSERAIWKIVGYVWVLGWLTFSLQSIVDWGLRWGLVQPQLPFSIVGTAIKWFQII